MTRHILLFVLIAATTAILGGLLLLARTPALDVPARGVVLQDVTVVNPGRARRAGQTLTVEGDRIAALADTPFGAAPGPYSGAFVLPGLIDVHVHHPPAWAPGERDLYALLFLAHGVTSVRDTGSYFGDLFGQRRRIAAGEIPGPRIFSCGPPLDGEGSLWPGARVVRDAAEGERAVRELAAEGVDCIKIYNGLEFEGYRGVRRAADELGLPIVAHVPRGVALSGLGPVEVQHLMGIAPSWDEITPEALGRYVAVSRDRHLAHTPTLVALSKWAQLERGTRLRDDPAVSLVPPHYPALVWDPEKNPLLRRLAPVEPAKAGERLRIMEWLTDELHLAGVPILAGTDTGNPFVVPGASLHEELGLLVESGLTPEEAWVAATSAAGTALRQPGLGIVEQGAPADLLIFREDPTRDLAALGTLEAVLADGRLYTKAQLDADLERWRTWQSAPLRRAASGALARAALAGVRFRFWLTAPDEGSRDESAPAR